MISVVFNLFFLSINITKRTFTEEEIELERRRSFSRDQKIKMQVKQAQYSRLM
ncbi:YrzI family small protein [Evansella sp. AB-P1]|uniref:YrzI family small protein n=1 Tax=Evansella sp. AB-P1 TaxID=3037653 RepID=UPI00241FAA3C|nr:YrzI family small protein [Evansella sp. AB-P1]MDG5786075.1 YrzI family small protein [Evansella sp. AB-P1]